MGCWFGVFICFLFGGRAWGIPRVFFVLCCGTGDSEILSFLVAVLSRFHVEMWRLQEKLVKKKMKNCPNLKLDKEEEKCL